MIDMKNILFISPKSEYYHPSLLGPPPLSGLLLLATILRDKGHYVRFIDEIIKTPDYNNIDDVDFVLISSMGSTVKRAYFLSKLFKNKGIKVVLGGIHVSFLPNEALNFCNQVVVGEAEEVIADVVEGKIKSKIVQGVRSDDLGKYPMPDYSLVEGIKKNPDVIGVTTSRGCPFECKFCSLSPFFGRKLRSVPTDKIINYLLQFKGIKKLHFHEANFTVDKKRAIELLKKMKENEIFPKKALSLQSIDVASNDKILKLMSEISDFYLLIGFESINQAALDFYNKKQTPEMIRKSIKKIHDYDIKIMGNFVFGSDTDDKSIFQKIVDFCSYSEIDIPGFDCLTPFIGTSLRKELEAQNRIFCNDWDFYDMQHAVFYPKKMSPLDLQEGLISAYEKFYSTRNIIYDLMRLKISQSVSTFYMKNYYKILIEKNDSYLDYLQGIPTRS
ncbi:MAG: B12-binding domain-containing radical SAM protein [Thermoplasmatales archaeon]|nr:MAG: B12-binding domain-containing radical SAM protein [Thermoplasmatales archaeon]